MNANLVKRASSTKKHTESPERIIRDAEFGKRLTQACDGHAHCPVKHNGRLTWIKRQLEQHFDLEVSVETVRKWFAGEAKPRPDKMEKLAQLLEVDVAWLSLGVDPDLQPREQRARNAMADGAVNLVAGLIQMDGGYPAFPEVGDKTAKENHVDLHAIIKGAKYDFHIALGAADGKRFKFSVPTTYPNTLVLGVVKKGNDVTIFEVSSDLIEHGRKRGGSIEIFVDNSEIQKRQIKDFTTRL